MDHAPTTHDSKALLHAIFVVSVSAMYVCVTLFWTELVADNIIIILIIRLFCRAKVSSWG